MKLTKSINKFTLLASSIAGIVGSGWLLGPMACAKIAGPASIITWIIAGVLMMIVASTFVLLMRDKPMTGGTVRLFQIHYGHFAGFGFAWIAWLAWVAVTPIETMALIQYSASYIPGLMTSGNSPVLTMNGIFVAMGLTALITVINNFGVRTYDKANYIILAFKMFIPIITAMILLTSHFNVNNFSAGGGFASEGIQSIFSALPLAGVIYSFIGFNPAIQLAAESKNPRRDIPIAIFGALAICIVLYTILQIAFIGALPSASISHGWDAINFIGDQGPFVGLLTGISFVVFAKALYVDAAISPFGTALVQSMATSRLTYAMSENGYFPQGLKQVNKYGSPVRAMLVNMVIGFAFFLPFPSWQHMVGFLVSCLVLGYVVGPMSLIIANQKTKKSVSMLCLVAFYICNLMIYWSGWDTISKLSILFAVGYIIFAIKIVVTNKSFDFKQLQFYRGSWVISYMIGIAMISYLGSFGGEQVIPFGYDFIVIAIFSAVIFYLAKYLVQETGYGILTAS